MSSIEIIENSITKMDTEAVVNAANSGLREGSGVCGYIFDAAGNRELQEACNKIGHCNTGDAVITPGFKMKNKYIIHAVGPVWEGGNKGERKLLYGAYYNSLLRAKENSITSIAFPLISAGIFGYPIDKAWEVAFEAISDFFEKEAYDIEVEFAVLDFEIYKKGMSYLVNYNMRTKKDPRSVFQKKILENNDKRKSVVLPFYSENDKLTGPLSNWWREDFEYAGKKYNSTEQYMMYQKAMVFHDSHTAFEIMETDNLQEIKALGRSVKNFDEALWSKLSMRILKQGVRAKFQQSEYCRNCLMDTGCKILAEAAPRDTIWGIGLDIDNPDIQDVSKWKGKNQLGKVLMQVRRDIALWKEKGIDFINHVDDPANQYWVMSFEQLRQIPQVWEIVGKFYDVAVYDLGGYYRQDFDKYNLDRLEYSMRFDMGGGIWIGQFYEVKQELYDMVYYGML